MGFFGGAGVTNDPARFPCSPRRWSLERTHSRKQPCSLSLLPTAPEHLRLTSFSALFPGNITSQLPGSWVCWSMASGSSCDPQSGSSRLFPLFTLSWRSSYQHCPLPRPHRNSFSRFSPFPGQPHSAWQRPESFCSQDWDPPHNKPACRLLISESGLLPPTLSSLSTTLPPFREAMDHQVWMQCWVVD